MVTRPKQKPYSISRLLRSSLWNPDPIDTQDTEVDGRIVSFKEKFKYLGSLIADKLTDNAECNARISAGSKGFGAFKTSTAYMYQS
jgi:hypothetical protein